MFSPVKFYIKLTSRINLLYPLLLHGVSSLGWKLANAHVDV